MTKKQMTRKQMTRKQRLSLNAQIRARGYAAGLIAGREQVEAEQKAKRKEEQDALREYDRKYRAQEMARREAVYRENQLRLAEFDAIVGTITQAEKELFEASPAYQKYQEYRRNKEQRGPQHNVLKIVTRS